MKDEKRKKFSYIRKILRNIPICDIVKAKIKVFGMKSKSTCFFLLFEMAIHRLTIGSFLRYEKKANKNDMNILFKELVQLTFNKIMSYNKMKS